MIWTTIIPMITKIPLTGRLIAVLGALAFIGFLIWWTYNQGYEACEMKKQNQTIKKVTDVLEKRRERAINPVTISDVVKRMRNGTF